MEILRHPPHLFLLLNDVLNLQRYLKRLPALQRPGEGNRDAGGEGEARSRGRRGGDLHPGHLRGLGVEHP